MGGQASETSADSGELAGFGYKQELDRSLGSFSSFAAGFSYISILTGVFQLFAFGFAFAGPARMVDVARSSSSARCRSPCASPSSRASTRSPARSTSGPSASRRDFTSWMAGWIMVVGSIVTVAAVAVACR